MTEAIQIGLGGVLQGCIYALLAVGFSLVFRVTGIINLAQGGFCILGALLAHSFEAGLGWPLPLAALAAIIVTTAVGAALGAIAFVPGMKRLSNSNMLMLTAGILVLLTGAMLVIWGSQPYALRPFSGTVPVDIAGVLIPTQGFWVLGTTIAIVLFLWLLLQRSGIGRALRACAENPAAAALMGISVPGMTLFSFALASAIGAIAGIVIAPATSLQFDTGMLFTIFGFIAVVIGGTGSLPGVVAGGLLLGIANQLGTAYISSLFSNALSLALLLAVLLWRPGGLFSVTSARRQDVREAARVQQSLIRIAPRSAWAWCGIGLVVALCLPAVLPPGAMLDSLAITYILFIAVLGLNLLMGYGGQVSLGQAGFMAIGGYTAGALAVQYNVPPLLGILAGAVLSLVCALALALITMRLRGLYLALATLAFGLLIDSLAVGLDTITGGPSGLVGVPSFSIGAVDFGTPLRMYYLALGVLVVALLLVAGALRSSYGRALAAIRTDQTAAAALGINVNLHKLSAFAIAAVFGSIAGSLYAFDFNFLAPEMVNTSRSLDLVTMMVIGGEGTLLGPLFGVAVLTLLPTAVEALALYKTLASGVLLLAFFLYLPDGIFGGAVRLVRRLRAAPPAPQALAEQGLT
jgi:branched-chain amino acid transport system permease protein